MSEKIDPCRSAFEEWYTRHESRSLERSGQSYKLMPARLDWDAWKAAWSVRAAKSEWLPIAEAPRDGTFFLAVDAKGNQFVTRIAFSNKNKTQSRFIATNTNVAYGPPIAWQPLPQPPATE